MSDRKVNVKILSGNYEVCQKELTNLLSNGYEIKSSHVTQYEEVIGEVTPIGTAMKQHFTYHYTLVKEIN